MALEHVTSDMLMRIVDEALKQRSSIDGFPELVSLVPRLTGVRDGVQALIAGRPIEAGLGELRKEAGGHDKTHDRVHKLIKGLIDALVHHDDEAVCRAAALIVEVLYPTGLSIIQASWESEVAAAGPYQQRVARADVAAAVKTLASEIPRLSVHFDELAVASAALGATLSKIAAVEVTKAGQTEDPQLFAARQVAITTWATFARLVELVHAGDAPTARAAREALLGRWYRILSLPASGTGAATSTGAAGNSEGTGTD